MKQKIDEEEIDEEEIDENEIAKEFELIFKGNQAILCISSEFNEDPMLHTAFKKGHWSVEKGTIGAQKRTA